MSFSYLITAFTFLYFKEATAKADPKLLEPIMKGRSNYTRAPDEFVDDAIGYLNKKEQHL